MQIIKRLSPCCKSFVRRGFKLSQDYQTIYCISCGKKIDKPLDTMFPSETEVKR